MEKVNVLIADDHSIFRTGLRNTLKLLPFINKIGEVSNTVSLLKILREEDYQIVFFDLFAQDKEGQDCIMEIKSKHANIKTIAISVFSNEEYIIKMYEKNIEGYLFKNTDFKELKNAIENVLNGERYFCQQAANILFKKLLQAPKKILKKAELDLTDRETEILKLLCAQHSTLEIADMLYISDKTVTRHRQNLLEKTNSKNSVGLALYAINNGIYSL